MSHTRPRCLNCQQEIEVWLTRKPEFSCPHCHAKHISTYRQSLKQSIWIGLALWLIGVTTTYLITRSWPITLVMSIELCGIAAALIAVIIHKVRFRILLLEH